MSDIVNKLWGFCHTLRHDGIDYGDYIEQLTYLLFLKMADERGVEIPKGCDWTSLRDKSGTALTDHYRRRGYPQVAGEGGESPQAMIPASSMIRKKTATCLNDCSRGIVTPKYDNKKG